MDQQLRIVAACHIIYTLNYLGTAGAITYYDSNAYGHKEQIEAVFQHAINSA